MTALTLKLNQFEGPLELLVHLVQRREVNPSSLEIAAIIKAFLSNDSDDFDFASDFILLASQVALLKSRSLLPRQPKDPEEALPEEDLSKFDIIHHLVDYCRFKDAAEKFSQLEVKQSDFFTRGVKDDETHLPPGLSGVTLDELGGLFQEALKKAAKNFGTIEEEEYRVHDKILWVRNIVSKDPTLFVSLFERCTQKLEMIVTFLAVLELIKNGEVKVVKEEGDIKLYGA